MCRFVVFRSIPGKPRLLSHVVLAPEHSIVKQSFHCRERNKTKEDEVPGEINADGFGLGWYTPTIDAYPCIYTSTLPAWNNLNLCNLSSKIKSDLIFAHVRAASGSSAVTETNCHPFKFGRFMFMHNGYIANFKMIRRQLLTELDDDIYDWIKGTTDSECAFALFLHHLGDARHSTGTKCVDPQLIVQALNRTISQIVHCCAEHTKKAAGKASSTNNPAAATLENHSLLNFAVTDGFSVLLSRFIDGPGRPASLYYSVGSDFSSKDPNNKANYRMWQTDRREEVVIVASERLTAVEEDWIQVPANHMLLITPTLNVLVMPSLLSQPPFMSLSLPTLASETSTTGTTIPASAMMPVVLQSASISPLKSPCLPPVAATGPAAFEGAAWSRPLVAPSCSTFSLSSLPSTPGNAPLLASKKVTGLTIGEPKSPFLLSQDHLGRNLVDLSLALRSSYPNLNSMDV